MTVTDDLILLRSQYEQSLGAATAQVSHYRTQLEHVNALLLEQLIRPSNGFVSPTALQVVLPEPRDSVTPALENFREKPALSQGDTSQRDSVLETEFSVSESVDTPVEATTPKRRGRKAKVVDQLSLAKSSEGRVSLSLVSPYQGMKKQDAIAQLLESEAGKILSMDDIIERLYGNLNPRTFKAERVRMKSALYQGAKQKIWQKAPQPYSYFLKSSQSKATQSNSTIDAPVAPATPVTTVASFNKKKTNQGVPGIIKLPTQKVAPAKRRSTKPATPKKAPQDKKPQTQILSLQSKNLGARIILPMHEDFEGLSKIDAVLKVMKERPGKPVHIEDIMDRLFGVLSPEETRIEKGRMKDVMNRGRDRKLWIKAAAPMSFIVNPGV